MMLRFLAILVLLAACISYSCKSQTAKTVNRIYQTDTLVFLTYGMPDFDRQNAEYIIAKRWRMKYYRVADCMVTTQLQDSVEKHNKAIDSIAIRLFGKNWQHKFENEVNAEFEIEQKIIKLLSALPYVRSKNEELEKEGNGLHFITTPANKIGLNNVSIEGWGKVHGRDKWVSYYRLSVNLSNKSNKYVKLLSNKIIEK
jgi:hypothetical protein